MSYLSQWTLTYNDTFVSRQRACLTQQGDHWKDDERGDISALARSVLRIEAGPLTSFQSMIGASPGFADEVDNGDGTIDQSKVDDAEILATVQALWPTVAALYFDTQGQPITSLEESEGTP
jgi:hypothetical protein